MMDFFQKETPGRMTKFYHLIPFSKYQRFKIFISASHHYRNYSPKKKGKNNQKLHIKTSDIQMLTSDNAYINVLCRPLLKIHHY